MVTFEGAVDSRCVFGAPSSRTSFVLARPPFTRTPFSPLSNGRRPKVLCVRPVTPAVICARSKTLRPRVGMASTSSLLSTVPWLPVCVSSSGTSAVTLTVSVVPPRSSLKSTATRSATRSSTLRRITVLNPFADTVTEYVPGLIGGIAVESVIVGDGLRDDVRLQVLDLHNRGRNDGALRVGHGSIDDGAGLLTPRSDRQQIQREREPRERTKFHFPLQSTAWLDRTPSDVYRIARKRGCQVRRSVPAYTRPY